jgi:hypothetical protein
VQTPEEIESRQRMFILEYVKLGMDFYSAAVAAECTPILIERLQEDDSFQALVKLCVAQKEQELLKKLEKASEISLMKGDTRALERILEILNPDRYSRVTKLAHQFGKGNGKVPKKISIEFVGAGDIESVSEE